MGHSDVGSQGSMTLRSKPPLTDVRRFLREKRGLIVHFSGTPGGNHLDYRYPQDLQRVVKGLAMSGVCASLVTPGDNSDGTNGERNAFGTIGVVLDLSDRRSLATAQPHDGGAHFRNGLRVFDEKDELTIADLEESLSKRAGHNEWGVRDYIVRGLFAIHPMEIWAKVFEDPVFGTMEGAVPINTARLTADLPDLRVYTFRNGGIWQLHPRPERPVELASRGVV
jgi:hypothetical protein